MRCTLFSGLKIINYSPSFAGRFISALPRYSFAPLTALLVEGGGFSPNLANSSETTETDGYYVVFIPRPGAKQRVETHDDPP